MPALIEETRCNDWILSPASNIHIASDRSWFEKYTLYSTKVHLGINGLDEGPELDVLGFGHVFLPVKLDDGEDDPAVRPLVTLSHVLHVPDCFTNIIGNPIYKKHFYGEEDNEPALVDEFGCPIAKFTSVAAGLLRLNLADNVRGVSKVEVFEKTGYNAQVSMSEENLRELRTFGIDFARGGSKANSANPNDQNFGRNKDWIISTDSGACSAVWRSWFTEYTAFESTAVISSAEGDEDVKVEGVGTAVIKVRRSGRQNGARSKNFITLYETLHIPTMEFNIVGSAICDDYPMVSDTGLKDECGVVGSLVIKNGDFLSLHVSGDTAGVSSFAEAKENVAETYSIRINWSDEERERYRALKEKEREEVNLDLRRREMPKVVERRSSRPRTMASLISSSGQSEQAEQMPDSSRYTHEEVLWIKKYYGSEFQFLRSFVLKISSPSDRDEGRQKLRQFLQVELLDDEECAAMDFVKKMSNAEILWIDERFGSITQFMQCYGLKPGDFYDFEEAIAIVRWLMGGFKE